MSWDVLICGAPPSAATMADLPPGFNPPPLGDGADLRRRLRAALPGLDLTDPAWGHLTGPTWSIELNIGFRDPVDSIMLHVRGGGDVLGAIARIAITVGGRALDMSTGEFLTGDAGQTDGWDGFQRYRDQALGDR